MLRKGNQELFIYQRQCFGIEKKLMEKLIKQTYRINSLLPTIQFDCWRMQGTEKEQQLNQNGRPKQAVILYQLTPEMISQAKQKIDKDEGYLPEMKYKQAKDKASKVWDSFYSNHKCNFFKDRNYLEREMKEITYFREKHEIQKKIFTYLELGCGVGNTLFPLLRQYPFFNYQGCDISSQAIKLIENQMNDHPQYKQRLDVRTCDLVKDQIPFELKPDLLSMIFVLSAIVPEKHQQVIDKIAKWMKPGSCFFFRDYGRYDFGQVNMSNKGNRKLKDNFYVKHDGVCVYYFDQDQLQKLFQKSGLVKVEGRPHCRLLQNRKTGLKMYRIWVQGRFYKPPIQKFLQQRIRSEVKEQKGRKQEQLEEKQAQKVRNTQIIKKDSEQIALRKQAKIEQPENQYSKQNQVKHKQPKDN